MAGEIGSAYLTLMPSLKGAKASIEGQLKGIDVSGAGDSMGGGLVNGMKAKLGAGAAIIAGAVMGIAQQATSAIMNSLSDGIARADIINNFPRVMSNFGIGAKDAKASVDKLSDSLRGLPTGLDAAASGVQRLVMKNGDIDKSTDLFLALNNAILAGGAPMAQQQNALEQLNQAYSKGKMDTREWMTLQMAMPGQLNQVAQAMGLSADALGEGLRNGEISMDDFMDTIARLNKEGVGNFKSFEEQARNATAGIQTSIQNMGNAMARGWEKVLNAIGQENIKGMFDGLSKGIDEGAKVIAGGIKTALPYVQSFFGFFKDDPKRATDAIAGMVSAFVGIKAIKPVTDIAQSFGSVIGQAKVQMQLASMEGLGFKDKMLGAGFAVKEAAVNSQGFQAVLGGLKTGLIGIGVALAGIAIKTAIEHFAHLKKVEEDTAVATGTLFKWTNDAAGALPGLADGAEIAAGGLKPLKSEVDDLIEKHAGLVRGIQETFAATGSDIGLLEHYRDTIHDLAGKSNLTAKEQADLQLAVSEVNNICGTNIEVIDGVNGKLSESLGAIDAATEAWKRNALAQAAQEKMVDITKLQLENDLALVRATDELEAAQTRLDNEIATAGPYQKLYADQVGDARKEVERLNKEDAALEDQMDELTGVITANSSAFDSTAEAISGFIGRNAELSQILVDNGVSVDDFAGTLSALGVTTTDLSTLTSEQLAGMAANYDGTLSSISDRAHMFGVELPTTMATNLSDPTGQVQRSFEKDLLEKGILKPLDDTRQKSAVFGDRLPGVIAQGAGDPRGEVKTSMGITVNTGILSPLDAATTEVLSLGGKVGANLASGIGGSKGVVNAEASSVKTGAVTNISGANTYAVGTSFASGMASGIKAAAGNVAQQASRMVTDAINAARAAQQSKSPAKVLVKEGQNFGEGYEGGIDDATPSVVKKAESMVEQAIEAAKGTVPVDIALTGGAASASKLSAGNGPTGGSNIYNLYLDGDLLQVDGRVSDALEVIFSAVKRNINMKPVMA